MTRINPQDYIGKDYGELTVKELFKKDLAKGRRRTYARCNCSCGNIHEVDLRNLRSGGVKSCGCMARRKYLEKAQEEIGNKYGLLTIKKVYPKRKPSGKNIYYAVCKCECGKKQHHVSFTNLKSGSTKSCGCLRDKHGGVSNSNKRAYQIWRRMMRSCYAQYDISYKKRGAKGIKVYEGRHTFGGRWRDNEQHYSDTKYFTRKDYFGDFNKDNCIRSESFRSSFFDLFEKESIEEIEALLP